MTGNAELHPSLTMVSTPEEATNATVRWSRKITLVSDRVAVISDSFETAGEPAMIFASFPAFRGGSLSFEKRSR
jgi:hypothetical protein